MKYHFTGTSAVLALLLSAGLAAAQTSTTPSYESTVTTGIVGWALASQTAQLTVLNSGAALIAVPGSSSTTATTCPVELAFYDAQNNLLKSTQVANVAPGTASSLTLKLADLTTAPTGLRIDIRGVVKSNPLTTGSGTASLPNIPLFSVCSLVTTMELFDNTTGVTQVLTSDTRAVATLIALPLPVSNGR
jgi:hypothetical protein